MNTIKNSFSKIKASDEVVFPLKQHIGAPCQPIVKVKDEIKVGQVIACSDAFVHCYGDAHGSLYQ